jgi:hypothetical protein
VRQDHHQREEPAQRVQDYPYEIAIFLTFIVICYFIIGVCCLFALARSDLWPPIHRGGGSWGTCRRAEVHLPRHPVQVCHRLAPALWQRRIRHVRAFAQLPSAWRCAAQCYSPPITSDFQYCFRKAAGLELKGAMRYYLCEGLSVPLMALVLKWPPFP